jgi:hypothetical protein
MVSILNRRSIAAIFVALMSSVILFKVLRNSSGSGSGQRDEHRLQTADGDSDAPKNSRKAAAGLGGSHFGSTPAIAIVPSQSDSQTFEAHTSQVPNPLEEPLTTDLSELNFAGVQSRINGSNQQDLVDLSADLYFLCALRIENEAQLARWLQIGMVPNTTAGIHSARWLSQKLAVPCAGYTEPRARRTPQELAAFSEAANARAYETSLTGDIQLFFSAAQTKPELFNVGLGSLLTKATSPRHFRMVGSLNMLSKTYWRFGARFYIKDIRQRWSLALAQRIALDRRACDLSRLCGSEQFDSLLLCAEFAVCRAGITSEQVWQEVASRRELLASESMYASILAGQFD